MGLNVSRNVEIEIVNKTRNFTLRNPRTYFFSGRILNLPESLVAPGSSTTCSFTNRTFLWGCNGVLAFEAESFTLAIYFSHPIDYNRFSPEMGLEVSLDKVHKSDLHMAYNRLVRRSCDLSNKDPMFPITILKEGQEEAQVVVGPVKVTVTMSRTRSARVVVEDQATKPRGRSADARGLKKEWGAAGKGARMESPCRRRHVQGTQRPGRHIQEVDGPGRHIQEK